MNSTTLARYNFRVMMHRNWWLLVIPVAASQLTVFWSIITQRFTPAVSANSVELVSPLLAAFLGAHVLAAEYRSGVGAILASKPVGIGRVVLLRLSVVIGLVWFLGLLSLAAYYFGSDTYDIRTAALAGVPSTLFLALLAMLFATLLRSSLAGFGIAALYWVMDLPPGPAIHPYLSLHTYALSIPLPGSPISQNLGEQWWVAKVVLLAMSVVLYLLHARAMFGLGVPLTVRSARRTLACAASLLVVYMASGAVIKVAYGYRHRGDLWPNDAAWFRRQLSSYGPIPVTSLFGSAFRRYVGQVPNTWRIQQEDESDLLGASEAHIRALNAVLKDSPNSIWAPSAGDLLTRILAHKQAVDEDVAMYRGLMARYPASPYNERAHREIARTYADAGREDAAVKAYGEVLESCRSTAYRSEALRYLVADDRKRGDLESAARRTRDWIAIASVQDKPTACIGLAEICAAQGKTPDAQVAAKLAIAAATDLNKAFEDGRIVGAGGSETKWRQDAASAVQRARAILARP